MNKYIDNLANWLNIVLTIAAKDIIDAVRNWLALAMIATSCLLMLLPKMLAWAIDPPFIQVTVYNPGHSVTLTKLEDNPGIRLQSANSMEELAMSLVNSLEAQLGLVVPESFGQANQSGKIIQLDGYTAWKDRSKAAQLKSDTEAIMTETLGEPVQIRVDGNLVYPPQNAGFALGILTINAVVIILGNGIILIPYLIIEEKNTKSIEALLVSPASITQIIIAKALAGLFYIFVLSGVVFLLNWRSVVNWPVSIVFTLTTGTLAAALGLMLGVFFERQQDIVGPAILLIGILVGTLFLKLINLKIHPFFATLVDWSPSLALIEIFNYAFLENVFWEQVWKNCGYVLLASVPFYLLSIWKIQRFE